jgi:hypothetical protein
MAELGVPRLTVFDKKKAIINDVFNSLSATEKIKKDVAMFQTLC